MLFGVLFWSICDAILTLSSMWNAYFWELPNNLSSLGNASPLHRDNENNLLSRIFPPSLQSLSHTVADLFYFSTADKNFMPVALQCEVDVNEVSPLKCMSGEISPLECNLGKSALSNVCLRAALRKNVKCTRLAWRQMVELIRWAFRLLFIPSNKLHICIQLSCTSGRTVNTLCM